MSQTKRIMALVIAVVMMMAMATTAFAEAGTDAPAEYTNRSITVTNTVPGETYAIYKMLDLEIVAGTPKDTYNYTVAQGWESFFAEEETKGHVLIEGNYVTAISDPDALAKAAAAWDKKPGPDGQKTAEQGKDVTFDNLANGYHLITSSFGTLAMAETTPDTGTVTVHEKNPQNTIDKQVMEDSTGVYGEANDAQIRDVVEFKSIATIQPSSRNVKIIDEMDAGLTPVYSNIMVYTDPELTNALTRSVSGKPGDWRQDRTDNGFIITIFDEYIETLTEPQNLYIVYRARLNGNAVVKGDNGVVIVDQDNKTKITYGNNFSSQEEKTTTTTHKFEVKKYAGNDETKANLAGATFRLQYQEIGEDGNPTGNYPTLRLVKIDELNYRVAAANETKSTNGMEIVYDFTTSDKGNTVIWGVDSDTYYLQESVAPTGYNRLEERVKVKVNEENTFEAQVENNKGGELPSTGGMGTTLLYVGGGILVAAAVVLLIFKKRMSVEK